MKKFLLWASVMMLFANSANATVITVNAFYTLTGSTSVTPPGIAVPASTALPYTYTIGLNAICNCLTPYYGNMFWWDKYKVDTYSSLDNILDDSIDTLVDTVTYSPSPSAHQFYSNLIDLTHYSFLVFTLITNDTVTGEPPKQNFYMWDIRLGHVVCTVPTPSSALMMLSGLIGLGGLLGRRVRSSTAGLTSTSSHTYAI